MSTEPSFITNLREFIIEVVCAELFKQKENFEQVKKPDEWLTINEAAKYIKVSSSTLWDMTKRGQLTKQFIDGKPRYRKSEIDNAFIKLITKKGGNHE